MKSLLEFINKSNIISISEHIDELNLVDSINYEHFSELLLFIQNSTIFSDRLQSICDTFRHKYNNNLSDSNLISSKIFNKFIDDSIEEYNKKYEQSKININIGTKQHLQQEIAAWMLPKIRLELEKIEIPSDTNE